MVINKKNCLKNNVDEAYPNIIPGLKTILLNITAIKGLDIPDVYRKSVTEKIFNRIHHFIEHSSKDLNMVNMSDIITYMQVPYVNIPVLHLIYKAVTNKVLPPIVVESYLLTEFCKDGKRSLLQEERGFFVDTYGANSFFLRKPSFSGSSAVCTDDMRMHCKIEKFTTDFDLLLNYVEDKGDLISVDDDGYFMAKGAFYGEKYIKNAIKTKVPTLVKDERHIIIQKPVSDEQREVVKNVLLSDSKFECITGSAGTGKTFVVSEIVDNAAMSGKKVICCAFTGKAASRMEQSEIDTSKLVVPPKTMHSMMSTLKYQFNGDADIDLIIIDEASTMNSELFNDFILTLSTTCSDYNKIKFIFVGDVHQLPPIGGGQIFEDIIDLDLFPVHRLTKIFRTTDLKMLELYAEILNRSQISPKKFKKFFTGYDDDNKDEFISKLVGKLFKSDSMWYKDSKCVILAHTNKFIDYLNYLCYRHINDDVIHFYENIFNDFDEDADEIPWRPLPVYWVGAKIVFTQNDRIELPENNGVIRVTNGTVGEVTELVGTMARIKNYDDGSSFLVEQNYDTVKLAFAMTVYKAQGSEANTIIYIHSNNIYESKRLVYTAVTRAKKNLKIYTPKDGFKMSKDVDRFTELNSI